MVNKYNIILLAVLTFWSSSCSKDKDETEEESHYNNYFTAVITPYGNPEKTYIESGEDNEYCCWADDDVVNINGTARTITVTGSANNHTATIGADGIESINSGFLAAYPAQAATVDNGTATFTLPDTTEYTTVVSGSGAGAQVVEAPMVAYSTTRNLQFENVGLLTLFRLKAEGSGQVTLQHISISSDRPLCGSYSLTRQGDGWQRNATGLDGTRRTLVCSNPIGLNATARPFYLYLPPVSGSTTFTVDITLSVNGVRRHFTKTKTGSVDLAAGKCYDFGTLTYNVGAETLTDNNSITYDEIEPAGTEADPYRIGNATEWYYWCNKFATTNDKHFLLENDITVSSSIAEFQGVLNGDGHMVELNGSALIKNLNGGTVSNVITGGSIVDNQYTYSNRHTCGSISAYASNARISHCINTAVINVNVDAANLMDIGGIVGYASVTAIDSCRNEANIGTAELNLVNFNAGGVVGMLTGIGSIVVNCCNTGNLNIKGKDGSMVGGAIGRAANNTQIHNSYSRGTVSSTGTITGGFIGSSKATIRSCYFNGNASYFCYENTALIQYCYHSCANTVYETSGTGSAPTNCHILTNATTIQGGSSLYEKLNENIITLAISGASLWSEANGVTVLNWELD